jgi:hypothetical protein
VTETSHVVLRSDCASVAGLRQRWRWTQVPSTIAGCAATDGRADGMLYRPSQFMMHIYTAHGTGVGWLSRLLGPRREPLPPIRTKSCESHAEER